MKQVLFVLILLPFLSCGQPGDSSFYNKKDYIEKKRGREDGYPFVIVYVNKKDNRYTLKENFLLDSTYTSKTYTSAYFYLNIPNGPFTGFLNGQITEKGFFKMGQYDGERLSYKNGVLTKKAYFNNGEKVGRWENFDDEGKLIYTVTFEANGYSVKEDYDKEGVVTQITTFDENGRIVKIEKRN
jgi:antitoxin component YwqK of YwqJK toxin-antitoxin module